MSRERLLLLVPPHCEASMPLLAPAQLAAHASKVNLDYETIDLNAVFRQHLLNTSIDTNESINGLGFFYHRMPHSLSPGSYWKSVDIYRASLLNARVFMPELTLHWDGADAEDEWYIFSGQYHFLEKRTYNTEWTNIYSNLWERLESFRPTVIGLSVTFASQVLESIALAHAIRHRSPNAAIVIGGGVINDCINEPRDIEGPFCELVDIVYRGQGEPFITALATHGVSNLKSIARKTRGRATFLKSKDLLTHTRTTIPCAPSFANDYLAFYASPTRIIPYRLAGRCYWGKCGFCSDLKYDGILWHTRHTRHHLDEIERLIDSNDIRGIFFLDSAMSPMCMSDLASGVIQKNLCLYWGTNARFEEELLQPGLLDLLFRGGCRLLRFGLESGSQKVLDLMNKGTKVGCAARILGECRDAGIISHVYAMVGFPGEGAADRCMTSDFLLTDTFHPDSFSISKFWLYPESPIGKQMGTYTCGQGAWVTGAYWADDETLDAFIEDTCRAFADTFNPTRALVSPAHTIAFSDLTRSWDTQMNSMGLHK